MRHYGPICLKLLSFLLCINSIRRQVESLISTQTIDVIIQLVAVNVISTTVAHDHDQEKLNAPEQPQPRLHKVKRLWFPTVILYVRRNSLSMCELTLNMLTLLNHN